MHGKNKFDSQTQISIFCFRIRCIPNFHCYFPNPIKNGPTRKLRRREIRWEYFSHRYLYSFYGLDTTYSTIIALVQIQDLSLHITIHCIHSTSYWICLWYTRRTRCWDITLHHVFICIPGLLLWFYSQSGLFCAYICDPTNNWPTSYSENWS